MLITSWLATHSTSYIYMGRQGCIWYVYVYVVHRMLLGMRVWTTYKSQKHTIYCWICAHRLTKNHTVYALLFLVNVFYFLCVFVFIYSIGWVRNVYTKWIEEGILANKQNCQQQYTIYIYIQIHGKWKIFLFKVSFSGHHNEDVCHYQLTLLSSLITP